MKTVKIVTMNGTDIKKSSKLKKTDFGERETWKVKTMN